MKAGVRDAQPREHPLCVYQEPRWVHTGEDSISRPANWQRAENTKGKLRDGKNAQRPILRLSQVNLLPYSSSNGGATRSPELVCLADMKFLEVEWLWEPYLPVGMLSMLSGDPGGGKTFISLAIAAALSNRQTPYKREPRTP